MRDKNYKAFIVGGKCRTTIRCKGLPTTVVTESEPDEYGQQVAMSLCTDHLLIFVNEQGRDMMKYRLQSIRNWQIDEAEGLEYAG